MPSGPWNEPLRWNGELSINSIWTLDVLSFLQSAACQVIVLTPADVGFGFRGEDVPVISLFTRRKRASMVRRSRQTSGRKEGEGEGGLRDEGRRVTRRYGVDQELSFGLSEFYHQPEDRTLGSTMGPPVNPSEKPGERQRARLIAGEPGRNVAKLI